ncbi:MAG: redoxin domain-containing protein [Balneola sp.]
MIKNYSKIVLFAAFVLWLNTEVSAQNSLKIGSDAPMLDHSVEDVNNRSITLSQIAESNGLLVIFSCNTCPWVSRWEDRMKSISNTARINNVGMIALNPNERIRERGESISDMKRRSTKQTYNFIYAMDKDHEIADAFGATKTPEVFLFDGAMKLVYKGSIDDNPNNSSSVKNNYLLDAIQAMVDGSAIINSRTKLQGCSIKRIE